MKKSVIFIFIVILLSTSVYAFSLNDFLTRLRSEVNSIIEGCNECDGKVSELTLEYQGNQPALITIFQKEGELVFNNTLNPNNQFLLRGLDKKDTLSPWIDIFIDNIETTRIHTSCSIPIGPGFVSGDFIVISGRSRNGGNLCPYITIPTNQTNITLPPEANQTNITLPPSNITLPPEANQTNITLPPEIIPPSNITLPPENKTTIIPLPLTNQTNTTLPPSNVTIITEPPTTNPGTQQPEIIEHSPTKILQTQKLLKFPQRSSGSSGSNPSDREPIINIGEKLPPIEDTKNRIIDLAFVVDAWIILLLIILAIVTEKKIQDHNKKVKEKYNEIKLRR